MQHHAAEMFGAEKTAQFVGIFLYAIIRGDCVRLSV
jgi:hypothetical protein